MPSSVTGTGIWKRLDVEPEFQQAVKHLRSTASEIGARIADVIPDFTDHSVRHMDALWAVTDQVLTPSEVERFTLSEAFVLACSFYIHDLGMAVAITPEGRKQLETSPAYASVYERAVKADGYDSASARVLALKLAAREQHASVAERLIDEKLPGLDRYLLESTTLRTHWGEQIGTVAASHHWSLSEVDRRAGSRGKIPTPVGDTIDLGFLAGVLRIADYAHINSDRASTLDRILRSSIAAESLKHWNAQEFITGPFRESNHIVYGCTRAIADVDGWWVFYEMASGLDREISAVSEYIAGRSCSEGRFSLESVKGVRTPQSFATYVRTTGFEPVDVRFRSDSMARLVSILGGRTLYGSDHFAPIRELLQNARDAIALQQAVDIAQSRSPRGGTIKLSLEVKKEGGELSIVDDGIGMSPHIITNFLLGIAANYWQSNECFAEFAGVIGSGFKPVGRFGIGFLSVFMVGNMVEVETERRGGERLLLRLYGVGRRGALLKKSATGISGTTIRIKVANAELSTYDELAAIVRAKAPMLDIPVDVHQQAAVTRVEPQWWKSVSQDEFSAFLFNREQISTTPARMRGRSNVPIGQRIGARHPRTLRDISPVEKWPDQQPEVIREDLRIIAIPKVSQVVLCSKGFAISTVQANGITGLVEVGDVELNAARTEPLSWDTPTLRKNLIDLLRPEIRHSLDRMALHGSIPGRYRFLAKVGLLYGEDLLRTTTLPWISIVDPMGQTSLTSAAGFLELLGGRHEVILVYNNVHPWSVATFAYERFPEATRNTIYVPIEGAPDTTIVPVDYSGREQMAWGGLPDLLSGPDALKQTPLLFATLKLLAQAWHMPLTSLLGANWSRHNRTVAARLLR